LSNRPSSCRASSTECAASSTGRRAAPEGEAVVIRLILRACSRRHVVLVAAEHPGGVVAWKSYPLGTPRPAPRPPDRSAMMRSFDLASKSAVSTSRPAPTTSPADGRPCLGRSISAGSGRWTTAPVAAIIWLQVRVDPASSSAIGISDRRSTSAWHITVVQHVLEYLCPVDASRFVRLGGGPLPSLIRWSFRQSRSVNRPLQLLRRPEGELVPTTVRRLLGAPSPRVRVATLGEVVYVGPRCRSAPSGPDGDYASRSRSAAGGARASPGPRRAPRQSMVPVAARKSPRVTPPP